MRSCTASTAGAARRCSVESARWPDGLLPPSAPRTPPMIPKSTMTALYPLQPLHLLVGLSTGTPASCAAPSARCIPLFAPPTATPCTYSFLPHLLVGHKDDGSAGQLRSLASPPLPPALPPSYRTCLLAIRMTGAPASCAAPSTRSRAARDSSKRASLAESTT